MTDKHCPKCGKAFYGRSNKKFCSHKCRKLFSQQTIRATTPVNSKNSKCKKREQYELFDKALRLAEMLYTLPPHERLGFMENLILMARSGKHPKLKQILTMPTLLKDNCENELLFWRQTPANHRTISQAANNYCKRFWKRNVIFVMNNPEYQPNTGEVI